MQTDTPQINFLISQLKKIISLVIFISFPEKMMVQWNVSFCSVRMKNLAAQLALVNLINV